MHLTSSPSLPPSRDWGMAASTEKEMKEWMEAFEVSSHVIIAIATYD